MEDSTNQKSIRKFILTCPKYEHLLDGFRELNYKYWPEAAMWTVISEDKPYSDMLIDYFSKIDDEYIMIMHEDFYLRSPVDNEKYERIVEWVWKNKPDRFGLQGIDDGYIGATQLVEDDIYRIGKNHNYLCSFEAGIWRRQFLLDHLAPNENPWQTEVNASLRTRGKDVKVYTTKEPTLVYKDAMIHGQPRIKKVNGKYKVLVPGDTWEDLCE